MKEQTTVVSAVAQRHSNGCVAAELGIEGMTCWPRKVKGGPGKLKGR